MGSSSTSYSSRSSNKAFPDNSPLFSLKWEKFTRLQFVRRPGKGIASSPEKSLEIKNRNDYSPSALPCQSWGLRNVAEIGMYDIYEVVVRGIVFCLVFIRERLLAGISLLYSTLCYISYQINLCSLVGKLPWISFLNLFWNQVLYYTTINTAILGKRQDALYLAQLREAIINARQIQKGK